MYPAQTSMMPVQVALARFWERGGDIFGHYPYWYLGTTPFRYLTGPILPLSLVFLHRLFPGYSLFEILFFQVFIFWLLGGVGIYLLVKELGAEKRVALLIALFYLFGPIIPFLFPFSDGLHLISFSFLPYILLLYLKFLTKAAPKWAIFCMFLIAFVMLTNILIVFPLILGMGTVLLATTGWKKAEEKLKKSLVLGAWCLVLVTLWYSPGFWWQLLLAPSFAGKPLFKVVGQLAQLLPMALAVGLAIVSGKVVKSQSKTARFCFYWLFIFGFLTFVRFLSDPDFWLDWSSYGTELQFGLSFLVALWVIRFKKPLRGALTGFLGLFFFISWLFLFNKRVMGTLQKDITKSVEYKIGSQLAKVAKPTDKVFLSGSTTFWLNAFFDIAQVRGGADQASVHPDWRKAAWEIREGEEVEKSLKWLRELKISYLVVHTKDSREFYHDFKNPEKFEGARELKKVYDKAGDRIYGVVRGLQKGQ